MKSISVLLLLAGTISPTLSQPHTAVINHSPESARLDARSDLVPFACHKANELVVGQLAEISQLQSRALPIPADLAGYFYAVVHGRKMLGCPASNFLSHNSSSSSVPQPLKRSSEPADPNGHFPGWGDPCEVARILKDQAMDQILVLRDNNIQIPAYLAGWLSVTKDADKNLKCGFLGAGMEELTELSVQNATSSK